MKKSICFLFLTFFFSDFLFSQENDSSKNEYIKIYSSEYSCFYITPGNIYKLEWGEDDPVYYNLIKKPRNLFRIDNNGFVYWCNNIKDYKTSEKEKINSFLFMGGPNYCSVSFEEIKKNVNYEVDNNHGLYDPNYGKLTFTASSCLTEKINGNKITYNADNLGKNFVGAYDKGSQNLLFNCDVTPWVEGVNGNGIGESIKISSSDNEGFKTLYFLNGYVDVKHPEYYKKNSRIKKMTVKDLDNNKIYEFSFLDVVMFQKMYFENSTKNVELIIDEVYEGSVYSDTCMTAIIVFWDGTYADDYNFNKQENKISNFSEQEFEELKKEVKKSQDYYKALENN